MRKQINVDWSRETKKGDLGPALREYERYLLNLGFRESTIVMYVFRVGKYLEFVETDQGGWRAALIHNYSINYNFIAPLINSRKR